MSGRGKAPHDQRPNKVSASAANTIAGRPRIFARAWAGGGPGQQHAGMSGTTDSPAARGSASSSASAVAGAPKQLFDTAYKYALVATRSKAPAEGG